MDEDVVDELETIRKRSKDGMLHPKEIVEFAKDEDTALHDKFEWDDTKAAYEYRLWQARQLIKVVVKIIPHTNIETSVYVSLKRDRANEGGYRPIADVLTDERLRNDLLTDAFEDFQIWKRKYRLVKELIPIFEAAEKVQKKTKKK